MRRAAGALSLGVVLTVLAAAFASPSLYVPGIGLALLAVVAGGWVRLAARGARVARSGGPPVVEESAPYRCRVEFRRGALMPPGGEIVEPLGGHAFPLRGAPSALDVEARFARRGRHRLDPCRMLIRDPLGLAEREVHSAPDEVLVLPRLEPLRAEQLTSVPGLGGQASRSSARHAELELDSLRPYRPGAPASRIHWPTVARSGTMMERKLVADVDLRPLVVVDSRRPTSESALDMALRAAASLCVHLARYGGCAALLSGDRRATVIEPDLRAFPALHARLALVEPADESPIAARLERGGPIFWVAAGGVAPPPGLLRAAAGARYFVSAEPLPGHTVAFTVAGCSGHPVGRGSRRAA